MLDVIPEGARPGSRAFARMDKRELRPLVLEVLRQEGQTHLHAIDSQIRRLAAQYQRHDILTLQEIIWELLLQGVLAPGKNSLNLNLPFVHVTEYGARCLEEDALLLHDPDGYMERLGKHVGPFLDEVVRESARESVLSFLAGRYLASMVMLGIGAQRSFDLLAAAYAKAIAEQTRQEAFKEAMRAAGRNSTRRFDLLQGELASLCLSAGLKDTLDPALLGLRNIIRCTHDDEGNPVIRPIERETAHANLLLFPQICARIYELINYLAEKRG